MFTRLAIIVLIAALSGCANFNSISRNSSLGGVDNTTNVAIHLDAQQRLVLSKKNMEIICAEPNPDAMAAYAAALGLGVQIPRLGGGSVAQSGSSSVADIGLRTQSITLMRDALYRLCEASMNGMANKYHMPPLLVRGMDLTAVVLATEQLTGAVAASQSALVASAKASAASSGSEMIRANEQALDIAEKDAKKTKEEYDTAKAALDVQDKVVIDKQAALNAAADEKDKEKFKIELDAEKVKQKSLQDDTTKKKEAQEKANKLVAEIKETREGILRQISTSAYAETGGDKVLNPNWSGKNLHENSEKNVATVANAVKEMVRHVLDKDYSPEGCLSFYGNFFTEQNPNNIAPGTLEMLKEIHANCQSGLISRANAKNYVDMKRADDAPNILKLEIEKLKLEKENKELEIKKMELEAKQGNDKEKPKVEASAKNN